MLRFVKDIRQLKLKMFGNTTFVLSKKIRQNNKMAFISSPKILYFTAESTMNVVFGLLKRLVDFTSYLVGYIYFYSVFQISFDFFVFQIFDHWNSFDCSDLTFFDFVLVCLDIF